MVASKIKFTSILLLALLGFLISLSCVNAHRLICTRIVDGDTIVLSNGEKVRLIGVDTPDNEEAVKLRATLFSNKNEANGSKMVADEVQP